ncbi:hypothetical protein V5N11_018747 [Cardamine amara subsp. amara]|uniref:Uncharacterized protein n=1 Tax=Cardamine amara subsp. amara TaxID=228776 RepID=A0ABD1BI83_CARAN
MCPTKTSKRPSRPRCIDDKHLEKCVSVSAYLFPKIQNELVVFLKNNTNTFAWSTEDMKGISLELTSHELNVDPTFKPRKQKHRKLGHERATSVRDEVDRLLKIGSIREVKYPNFLANLVVVKNKNGKGRVCVDFTDLNKACPQG